MKSPKGFLFNGINSGIKRKDNDLAVIICEPYAHAVGFFTSNEFQAESLLVTKKHILNDKIAAIVVNSGCANCALGKRGMNSALKICKKCADELGVDEEEILICSTGTIGVPLPDKKIISSVKKLISGALPEKSMDFAKAIMTTDKFPKHESIKLKNGVSILGIAKGAGMIEPNLATTLCFLLTDAKIKKTSFKKIVKQILEVTFNRISVDADESTNDTLLAISNAASGVNVEESKEYLDEFTKGVFSVLSRLSYQIVKNGEGATKVVKITVKRSKSKAIAEKIARKLASSMLFKTSIYGNRANWGRIISSIGSLKLGVGKSLDVYYGSTKVVNNGVSMYNNKKQADVYLKKNKEVEVIIDLKKGSLKFWIYTTDLSPQYVEMNK
ncbi:MAG: bifunctional glutamate N-acetyltransferase/amino-acid acetyltransferase ArgJ [Candidatus Saelkia tenebricola]|nr:bifunctional glutamate N-acetyltransferase/amino-acid acetyltransferase ArgJ [Candidatus Saelkia tenebricola]